MRNSTKIYLFLLIVFSCVAGIILMVSPKGEMVIFLNQNQSPFFSTFFRITTLLGDGIWFAPMVLIFLFIRYAWSAVFAALGIIQLLLIQGLKRGVFGKLPRPAEYFKETYELDFAEGIDIHHFYSFPSGHTATAFSITFMLVLITNPGKGVTATLFIIAFLVGISRVYLAQHFLEDVLMGAILGVLSVVIIWSIYNQIERRNADSPFFNSSLKHQVFSKS